MTKNLQNKLKVHRKAIGTKDYHSALNQIQAKLIKTTKYLYHKAYYLAPNIRMKVLCRSHGFFEETPENLLNKIGCPVCKIKQEQKQMFIHKNVKYNNSSFIRACKEANNYGYSDTVFKGFTKPIRVFCPVHRYFKVNRPHLCLSPKFMCPRCKGSRKIIN